MPSIFYTRTVIENDQTTPQTVESFFDHHLNEHTETQLFNITLSFANLSDAELRTVFYKTRNHQVKLDLSGNKINADRLLAIFRDIYTNRGHRIDKLALRHNDLDDRSATVLSQLMRYGIELDLSHNQIGPLGGEAYVRAAREHRNITVIDLDNNKLGNEGASRIAYALGSQAGNIKKLILTHNEIGFSGDRDLALHLPKCISVSHRVKVIPFSEGHPILTVILIILCFPIIFILPCLKSEKVVEGCEYIPREGEREEAARARPDAV